MFYVGLIINEIVCSDMQDAAGNIFVDRSGIWIRRHSHHSVINMLVGIFLIFQVVFRPAAYCGCLTICLYQTISTLTCVRSISIAKLSINSIRFRIDITDPSHIAGWDYLSCLS